MKCVNFSIVDDEIALEANELFMVTFNIQSSNTTAIPGDISSTTVTIIDEDGKTSPVYTIMN